MYLTDAARGGVRSNVSFEPGSKARNAKWGSRSALHLQLAQEVGDLWLGPIHRSDELATHHSVSVDDEGFGPAVCPVKGWSLLCWIAHGQKVYAMLLQKLPVSILVHIDAHRHDRDALRFHAVLHLHERRHLFDAGRTPSRPEIQHHNFSAKLGERDGAV